MKKPVGLVFSEKDPVSVNVLKVIKNTYLSKLERVEKSFEDISSIFYSRDINAYLIVTTRDLVHSEHINNLEDLVSRFIFISRHESSSRLPSLLAHFPGNWLPNASLGGRPEELGIADPIFEKIYLQKIVEKVNEYGIDNQYQVSLEATHHGPTSIDKPITFIEIGSSPKEWNDEKAIAALCEAMINALHDLNTKNIDARIALGFGGPHYAPNFTKIALKTDIAMSHIAPRYVTNKLSEQILMQSIKKSMMKPSLVILDWKGLKREQRSRLIKFFSKFPEIEVLKTKDLQKTL